MLGVRYFQNTALDIWVGSLSDFACDQVLPSKATMSDIHPKTAHLVFFLQSTADFTDILSHFREQLSQNRKPSKLYRVTFLLEEASAYDPLQNALFETFKEMP